MAQTLDQIIGSLSNVYDPQVQSVQAQQAALPGQQQNDQAALQGQQTQAYDKILNGARARGTGVAFGGIPLGEQAQYNSTTYQPALANLYASYNTKAGGLNDAINQINANRSKDAQGIYQFQVQQDQAAAALAEQQRQFNATQAMEQQKLALARQTAGGGGFSPSYGGGGGGVDPSAAPAGAAGAHASMTQRGGGGFNYTDGAGHAINAAQYAHITGQNFRDVLQQAANNGDAGSRAALAFVGNDYGYNPNAVTSQQQADLYRALTGRSAAVHQAPGPSVHNQVVSFGNSLLHNSFTGNNNSSAAAALAAQKAAHGGHL